MNSGYTYRFAVPRDASLIDFLCGEFPHSDRATWQARLTAGEVKPDDGGNRSPKTRRFAWRRPPWEEEAVPMTFEVVYDDADVLVVDKPSGLPTMPAGGFLDHTLLALVRRKAPDASPMHRLGRGTSGLVVFGKTPGVRSLLQAAWREHAVVKTYRALVAGVLAESVTINASIGPVVHPRLGTVHAAVPHGSPEARTAVSHVRPIAQNDGSTWVDVDIDTGRPHQIRIHLASIGHPLVGDPLYGVGGTPKSDALPGDLGYTLRAWRIVFPALDGEMKTVEIEPTAAPSPA